MFSPGPKFGADGNVTFQVWAPAHEKLSIRLLGRNETFQSLPMRREEDGKFALDCAATPGTEYWIEFSDGKLRPDPASRFQPQGVHGPSLLVDSNSYDWKTVDWRGVNKKDLVLYEMHVGTFSKLGTYRAAIEGLDRLVGLGITAIELMPIAETAGDRNWGYDGVNLFAPRHSYGSTDNLKEFVDAAHQRGIAVFLDVVYNHFGPEGNYLANFGGYISKKHKTPWGDGPNFDEDRARIMRDFVIANAKYWIEEYRFDGLRLDAIHCIADDSTPHIVSEISFAIDRMRSKLGREICLIAESNVYDPELLTQLSENGHGFDAAWCDDFLHSVFAVLQPGVHMSARQYHPHSDLDIVLRRGFVFQGTLRTSRKRIPLLSPTSAVRLESLIFAIQNHDFIGNHPSGLRLHEIVGHDAHRAAAALLLMHPAIPMLFMGEEFASDNPFLFFVDFSDPQLRTAVEEGRKREYPQHSWNAESSPLAKKAFQRSFIGGISDGNLETFQWYKDLIRIRKDWRKSGLLMAENLEAQWDEAARLARLTYRKDNVVGTVLIRLHSQDEVPVSLELESNQRSQLTRNCHVDARDRSLRMDPNGVWIGQLVTMQ